MKKILRHLFLFMFASTMIVSCIEIDEQSFDEALLIGKWQSGTMYYKYLEDKSGITWDEADDITEAEAQAFTWTLIEAELTHIHVLEIGGTVPKVYIVTELTETSLKYEDDFGKIFSFIKVAD
ncbi:MAG: hypothetical protein PF541_12185 [Prolixibacteraceae bacterium]|jgi:hypothetical protein|nr:hypothetical protein [Prolixibacteraceae bacterium]